MHSQIIQTPFRSANHLAHQMQRPASAPRSVHQLAVGPHDGVLLLAAHSLVQHPGGDVTWQNRYFRRVRPHRRQRVAVHDDEAVVRITLDSWHAEGSSTAASAH